MPGDVRRLWHQFRKLWVASIAMGVGTSARRQREMRDEALTEDEMAKDKAAHEHIVRRLTEELNRA